MYNSKWRLVHNGYRTGTPSEIWRKIRLHTRIIVFVCPNFKKKSVISFEFSINFWDC